MRIRILIAAGLLAALLPATAVAQKAPTSFETKAAQAYMIEASTGTVLLAKNEDQPISPASLSKLMTLDVVFDALKTGEIGLDSEYPVSEHAWRTGGAPSRTATMFAALKSRIRVEDLIRGVAVQMANDACIILAEGIDGSEEKFAARMTARARQLGLSRSTFANASGLPDPANRTTLKELTRLARHIQVSYPDYYRYFSEPEFLWNGILQRNRNPLLARVPGVDGLSTGFAEENGYGIVVSAERKGTRFILAMSGIASDRERSEEAARVLEWGFSAFENKRIFNTAEVIGSASVYGGDKGKVDLVAKAPVNIYVPVNNPDRLSARIVYRWPLTAPVAAGAGVGQLQIFSGEQLTREVPLYAAEAVGTGTLRQRATDALLELMFFWL